MIPLITYTIIEDGVLKGAPCFMVEIGKGLLTTEEAVDSIIRIRQFKAPGCKFVILHGEFDSDNQDGIFSMSKSLIDAGYTIGCLTTGRAFHPWMTMVKFHSVTPEGRWLGFKVQEFVWDTTLGKPQLPAEAEAGTALFCHGSDVDAFMRGSPLLWRVWGAPEISHPV